MEMKWQTVLACSESALFDPIAPRKATIVCNFGLSKCNRVKEQADQGLH